ncbi:hypothetical protein A5906_09510 [Bradyrhizobium sacchari]|nr:hypothetical protein A5906_09510 [Bradyrhizobium sacchari]
MMTIAVSAIASATSRVVIAGSQHDQRDISRSITRDNRVITTFLDHLIANANEPKWALIITFNALIARSHNLGSQPLRPEPSARISSRSAPDRAQGYPQDWQANSASPRLPEGGRAAPF